MVSELHDFQRVPSRRLWPYCTWGHFCFLTAAWRATAFSRPDCLLTAPGTRMEPRTPARELGTGRKAAPAEQHFCGSTPRAGCRPQPWPGRLLCAVTTLSGLRHSDVKDVHKELHSHLKGYNLPAFTFFLSPKLSTSSIFHVLVLNLLIVGAGVVMACFYPNIGGIIRYGGPCPAWGPLSFSCGCCGCGFSWVGHQHLGLGTCGRGSLVSVTGSLASPLRGSNWEHRVP